MSEQPTKPHSIPVHIILRAMDLCITLMLLSRSNERTVQPTKRVTFPDNIKKGLAQFQEYRCMFCGARRKLPNLQIDHITPVVRGGSNETQNLQLLCAPCNQRKGMQTNEEFYARYQTTLRGTKPGRPPQKPIQQGKFKSETKNTRAGHEVRKFKKSRPISPATKIRSGSLIAGVLCGATWAMGWQLSFTEPSNLVGDISVFGGIASGLLTATVLMVRAKITGRYKQA